MELARRTKDYAVCKSVKERKTLMGDGSGVSPKACEAMVKAAQLADMQQAESARQHAAAIQGVFKISQLKAVAQGDGNWLVTVQMDGSLPGRYRVELPSSTPNRVSH